MTYCIPVEFGQPLRLWREGHFAVENHLGLGYRFGSRVKVRVAVYADANHTKEGTARRSVSRWAVLYGSSQIAWLSRSQVCVVLSITEAECVATRDGVLGGCFRA